MSSCFAPGFKSGYPCTRRQNKEFLFCSYDSISSTDSSETKTVDTPPEPRIPLNQVPPKPINILATLQERLHAELKQKVSLASAKRVHTVSNLTPYSNADEVQSWLSSKGFAARTQQRFQNMKGEDMFHLRKSDLEDDLGIDEGLRLFNQIIIQKNICGYKTLRATELSSVLEARRKKIDPDDGFSDRRDSYDSIALSIG